VFLEETLLHIIRFGPRSAYVPFDIYYKLIVHVDKVSFLGCDFTNQSSIIRVMRKMPGLRKVTIGPCTLCGIGPRTDTYDAVVNMKKQWILHPGPMSFGTYDEHLVGQLREEYGYSTNGTPTVRKPDIEWLYNLLEDKDHGFEVIGTARSSSDDYRGNSVEIVS
jgi:hypothetical protein